MSFWRSLQAGSVVLIILLTLALAGCGRPADTGPLPTVTSDVPTSVPEPTQTPEPMSILVDGEGITRAEFLAERQRYQEGIVQGGLPAPGEAQIDQAVTDELVSQLLLASAARGEGFALTDADLQTRLDQLTQQSGGQETFAAWLAANHYTPDSFKKALARSLSAAWMRDRIAAAVPLAAEQVHVQQIQMLSEAEAQQVLLQLQGGADFDELAALYDPAVKGDLGWFPRGFLVQPAVEEAAFTLQVGATSGVIASDVGYHILRLLEKDGARPLSPEALLSAQRNALASWLGSHRAEAEVQIIP